MAEFANPPPVHLVVHPDEPIRSLEAAAAVLRSHAGERPDGRTSGLLQRIERAGTPEEADEAGKAFPASGPRHEACCWCHPRTPEAFV